MKRIIASRGMGKTSRLISEAKQALRNNKKVIFVTGSRATHDRLRLECPDIEFMTLDEAVFKTKGRRFDNTEIFIDDLDICVATIFGTGKFTYSLTLGD